MRLLITSALLLTSCAPTPDYYPVPAQHKPVSAPEPTALNSFVSMADRRAELFFVTGISTQEGNQWRWTKDVATLRFHLEQVAETDAVLDFTISDVTYKNTGPVRMEVLVNGKPIGKETFSKQGEHSFRQPVPEGFLKTDSENELTLKIANPWIAPVDGAKLGVLLRSAGFLARKPSSAH